MKSAVGKHMNYEYLVGLIGVIIILALPVYQIFFSKMARDTREFHKINVLWDKYNKDLSIQNNLEKLLEFKEKVINLKTKNHTDKKELLLDFIKIKINQLKVE